MKETIPVTHVMCAFAICGFYFVHPPSPSPSEPSNVDDPVVQ